MSAVPKLYSRAVDTCGWRVLRDESVRENEIQRRGTSGLFRWTEGGIDRGRKSNFYDVLRGVRNERRLRYPVTMDRPVVPY